MYVVSQHDTTVNACVNTYLLYMISVILFHCFFFNKDYVWIKNLGYRVDIADVMP